MKQQGFYYPVVRDLSFRLCLRLTGTAHPWKHCRICRTERLFVSSPLYAALELDERWKTREARHFQLTGTMACWENMFSTSSSAERPTSQKLLTGAHCARSERTIFFKCQSYSAAPYWGFAVLFCLNFGVVFDRKHLYLCNRSSSLTEQEPRMCSEWHARVRRFGGLTSGCPHTEYHHTWQAWQQALLHHWPLQVKHFMWKWLVWTRSTSPLQGCPHLKHWMIRFPTWGWQPSWVWRTEGKEIPWFTKLSF